MTGKKMKNKFPIDASYDDVADVLYLSSRSCLKTKNEEKDAGLILRYDEKNHAPVGATIVDYKEYWKPKKKRLTARIAEFFGITKNQAEKVLRLSHEKRRNV